MQNKIESYLSKGMERRFAEYYASGRKEIVNVQVGDDRKLILTFNNGELRQYDVMPFIQPGTVFSPLIDSGVFNRVYLDEQHCVSWDIDPNIDSSIVWSNKIDLCPDTCYVDSKPIEP